MAIKYIEKGIALHVYVNSLGHLLQEKNGVWVSSDDTAVQQIIDNFDPEGIHSQYIRRDAIEQLEALEKAVFERVLSKVPQRAGTYKRKASIARKWLLLNSSEKATNITKVSYILVHGESNGTIIDVDRVANNITNRNTQQNTLLDSLEEKRRVFKLSILNGLIKSIPSVLSAAEISFSAIGK